MADSTANTSLDKYLVLNLRTNISSSDSLFFMNKALVGDALLPG